MERCANCRFWPISEWSTPDHPRGLGTGDGGRHSDCRRHAPPRADAKHYHPHERMYVNAAWPTTREDDWCGDWEARETPRPKGFRRLALWA